MQTSQPESVELSQPCPLLPGKCEQCRKPLDAARFALWCDHAKKRRSCQHLVCGTCRGIMMGWPTKNCPNSACNKRFNAIQDVIRPNASTTAEFFKFVNHTGSGKITKQELADWYQTNFDIPSDEAMVLIQSNWHHWDIPKSHSFLKGGWFRSKDQGDLDVDEFAAAHEFMKSSLAAAAGVSSVHATLPSLPRGTKRSQPEDSLTEGVLRNVAQKKQVQSQELQQKLKSGAGREWFTYFDFDKSGELSKSELTTALLHTFAGSHQMTRDKITAIVDGVWDSIDTDGSGAIQFEEFQMLREAIVAQLRHEEVATGV